MNPARWDLAIAVPGRYSWDKLNENSATWDAKWARRALLTWNQNHNLRRKLWWKFVLNVSGEGGAWYSEEPFLQHKTSFQLSCWRKLAFPCSKWTFPFLLDPRPCWPHSFWSQARALGSVTWTVADGDWPVGQSKPTHLRLPFSPDRVPRAERIVWCTYQTLLYY